MFTQQKYDYPVLESITQPTGSREYITPTGGLPSVTTILSQVGDKTALIEWRKRIGDAEADLQVKQATNIGSIMHSYLEDHIAGKERRSSSNMIYKLARGMADTIIGRGLSQVDSVWGYEVNLYYPGLYAGTADLIGTYNGVPALMDYKNSKKIKKREWIESYFMQLVAYSLAHNELFGTTIDYGVIFMASRDGNYKEFYLEGAEFKEYEDKWLEAVHNFYKTRNQ